MPSGSRWQTSCDRCGLKFQYLNQLKSHVTINHEVGDFPFKCRFCEKGFFFQNKLDIHVRTHTDDNPYECKECGMKFKQKPDLNKHDLVHSRVKNFECEECGRLYEKPEYILATTVNPKFVHILDLFLLLLL